MISTKCRGTCMSNESYLETYLGLVPSPWRGTAKRCNRFALSVFFFMIFVFVIFHIQYITLSPDSPLFGYLLCFFLNSQKKLSLFLVDIKKIEFFFHSNQRGVLSFFINQGKKPYLFFMAIGKEKRWKNHSLTLSFWGPFWLTTKLIQGK